MSTRALVLSASAALLLVACATARPAPAPTPCPGAPTGATTASKEDIPPELATGRRAVEAVRAGKAMVSAANPHATRAGIAVLEAGGSAIDAAIAIQLVLGLVEPQSSGIGGGAFLLYWDAERRRLQAWDGRETAPAAATPDQFLGPDGKPLGFFDAFVGGLSVGTPGVLRLLETVHGEHGALPWARAFEAAIALAEAGFEVSPRLHSLVSADPALLQMPDTRAYFFEADGTPKEPGTVLTNAAYAETLRTVAAGGADAFYDGPLAEAIVAAVHGAPRRPGRLSIQDLRGYRPKLREPVCIDYRARHRVCGMSPPTSGGITTLQILGILQSLPLPDVQQDPVGAAHVFAEASGLAYADRALYLADPDFSPVPDGLLDPGYLASRAASVDARCGGGAATAGTPPGTTAGRWGQDRSPELPSTSHFVVVDASGDVVSMTSSVEMAFGSHLMVGGFLLNNQLTDFSFVPAAADGKPIANRVEAGKRPRSSMAPIIVLDAAGERAQLALGSPGGSRIIDYVAWSLIGVLDWGLDVQAAIDLPRVADRNGKVDLEKLDGPGAAWVAHVKAGLEARGHEVDVRDLNSGLHGVAIAPDGTLTGGADPRREGLVLGF